jgi:hypothetical protein
MKLTEKRLRERGDVPAMALEVKSIFRSLGATFVGIGRLFDNRTLTKSLQTFGVATDQIPVPDCRANFS